MADPDAARYARHSPYSDPGPHAERLRAVPPEPEALAAVARNVIAHYRADGDELPESSRPDVHLRWLGATLDVDARRHEGRPLAAPRALPDRVQGCCRDHTLFCVGVLREHGVPARSRVGWAGYLEPGFHRDHVIVEALTDRGWVRFDPEFADPLDALPAPYDIPSGPGAPFATAAEAWRAYRAGTADPMRYGVVPGGQDRGPWMLQTYVLHELVHRQGDELLLWDAWGHMTPAGDLEPGPAALADEVAELLVRADAGDRGAETELAGRYAADDRLHPGPAVQRFSPYGEPPVTERVGPRPVPAGRVSSRWTTGNRFHEDRRRAEGGPVGSYERSIEVEVAPERLFAYLSDVRHLPEYMPRLTSAQPQGGDRVEVTAHIDPEGGPERDVTGEAWLDVVEAGRRLEWGAPGPHDYHGELSVDAGSAAGTSLLTVSLHTERVEGDQIDRGLDETLQGIKRTAEAPEDPS